MKSRHLRALRRRQLCEDPRCEACHAKLHDRWLRRKAAKEGLEMTFETDDSGFICCRLNAEEAERAWREGYLTITPQEDAELSRAIPAKVGRGYFYPGEVVRILGLEGLDYHQLRRLFRLLAGPVEPGADTSHKWARFTFRDLVGLKAAIYLAGGTEALQPGRRLRLKEVERICKRLREEFGVLSPLAEVAFRRTGRTIVAQIQGVSFEPISGQLVLSETERDVARYLESRPDRTAGKSGQAFQRKLRREVEELRLSRKDSLQAQAALPL